MLLELSKEEKENHDNLAGNGAEAKEAVCEGRDEQRHWGGTRLALSSVQDRASVLSHRPAQEEQQPKGEGVWVHADLPAPGLPSSS